LERYKELVEEKEGLDGELAGFSDSDPVEMLRKGEETKRTREEAIKWSDNIEALESFISTLTNDRAATADIMARSCGDEYVPGEGLKELGFPE
jgi:hypothetical protein